MNHRLRMTALLVTTAVASTANAAGFTSARTLAMGGTSAASALPIDAVFSNPAMAAVKQDDSNDDFALMIPGIAVSAEVESELIDEIDTLQDQQDTFNRALDTKNVAGVQSSANEMINTLEGLDGEDTALDGQVGLALVVPDDAFSFGVFATGGLDLAGVIDISQTDISYLRSAANVKTQSDLNNLQRLGEDCGSTTCRSFDSSVRFVGIGMTEVGGTFASTLEIASEDIAVGVSPKMVSLVSYDYTASASSADADDIEASEYETDDSALTLDVGAAYQFGNEREWTTGLTIRNAREVDLQTIAGLDVTLARQMTAGISHRNEWFTLAADADLLTAEPIEGGRETRFVGVGAEFDVLDVLQLRAGIRENLAESESTQYSAGVGLNIIAVRAELAAVTDDDRVGAAFDLAVAF